MRRTRSLSLVLVGILLGVVMIAPAFAHHTPKHSARQIKKLNKKIKKLPTTSAVQQAIQTTLDGVIEPFAAFLDANGETKDLASHGPLRLFAKCLVNDGGVDKVQIYVDSTAAGWHDTNTGGGAGNPAGTPVLLFWNNGTTGQTSLDRDSDQGSAAAQSGGVTYSLGVGGDELTVGLNIFGHRCYVAGHAQKTTL